MRKIMTVMAVAMVVAACSSEPKPLVHEQYPQLCDAKLALIQATCERDARCGAISADEVDGCVQIYATYFGWSGCAYVPAADDSTYVACFADYKTMGCDDMNAQPSSCQGIFVAGDLVDSGAETPDQVSH